VIYLLDADTLIRSANTFYQIDRVPQFWSWLLERGADGAIKIPVEQYEEIVAGNDTLVDWLKDDENKDALVLDEEAVPAIVAKVTLDGYGELDESGLEAVGRDPFLISYAYQEKKNRSVVTFENSSPGRRGKNRKIPDVCSALGVKCVTLFDMIENLDFKIP